MRFLGFSADERLKDKLKSMKKSYSALQKAMAELARTGQAAVQERAVQPSRPSAAATKPSNIRAVQKLIGVKQTGVLDDQTKQALEGLKKSLEMTLGPALAKENLSMEGALLKPDGSVIRADMLKRLMDVARDYVLHKKKV